MRTGKGLQIGIPEIKTFNSQQSNIDLFSKLQSSFLEKFFKYNLSDYFSDLLVNVYEDLLSKKTNNKIQKVIANNLFFVNRSFIVEQFKQKVDKFYRSKSKSIVEGQLPYAFQFKYCNRSPTPNMIMENQLVYFQVKIKTEVQKVQKLPQKISQALSNFQNRRPNHKLSQFQHLLSQYKMDYINVFLVYFGDCNFNIFNKKDYDKFDKIMVMGRWYKVRIFVFFISRQALVQTFRTINKINNLQYINDLVIQFYQLRRQKQRRRRNRDKIQQIKQNYQEDNIIAKHSRTLYKIVAVVTLVGFGAIVKKIFF